ELLLESDGSYRDGAAALVTLRARVAGLDAVFFAGDVLAIGALLECHRRRWRVPADVAIASFDDFPIASSLQPRLTAIEIPRHEIGRAAATIIVGSSANATAPVRVDCGFRVLDAES